MEALNLSDDRGRGDVGVQVAAESYLYILMFFKYDAASAENDYLIERHFSTKYTPTVRLDITFPRQVVLS